jgi:outer membrane biosynthesis protein TonB
MIITAEEIVRDRKRRQTAAIAAILFAGLLFLIFFLFKLREYDPPRFEHPPVELEIEMEVLAGGSSGGSSVKSDPTPNPQPNPDPVIKPQVTPPTQVNTQPEPSDPIPTSNQQTNNNQQQQQQVNPNALFRPGGNGETGDGTGTGNGTGNQSGTGQGTGSGPGEGRFELAGRSLMVPPKINTETQEVGIIAMNIFVDQNGNVVNATYNRDKSDIQNAQLIEVCRKSAMKMKFDTNPGAAVEQKGVYYFKFVKE